MTHRFLATLFLIFYHITPVSADSNHYCDTFVTDSSIDGIQTSAHFCKSSKDFVPLLVFFPSWNGGLPYYEEVVALVKKRGWHFLAPKIRGANQFQVGSYLSIQDALDSIDSFIKKEGVKVSRIYAIGVSGGGYTSLMIAGKYPDLFSGISVWAAMTDLRDWDREMRTRKRPDYYYSIENNLGDPLANQAKYFSRSPISLSSTLKKVPIDLNAGITDGHHGVVAITHALQMYDAIANKHDQLTKEEYRILESGKSDLPFDTINDKTYGVKSVLFRKTSNKIRLTVFDGDHEMIPGAAIEWLQKQH